MGPVQASESREEQPTSKTVKTDTGNFVTRPAATIVN